MKAVIPLKKTGPMNIATIFLVSFALALDVFVVSLSCGIKIRHIAPLKFLKIAAIFALFQGVMPLGGWYMGALVKGQTSSFGNAIATIVLAILGAKTIYDGVFPSIKGLQPCACECDNPSCLLGLAVATSVDALLVGVVFCLLQVNLIVAVPVIASTTMLLSLFGLFMGIKAGNIIGKRAGILAGTILLALAIKSLF